jgi:hypothetical protein
MNWLTVSDNALIQDVGDEVVVLNVATENYFALNSSAKRFLEICRSEPSFDDAAARIVAEYGISLETARADLGDLIDRLVERSLIVVSQMPDRVAPPR